MNNTEVYKSIIEQIKLNKKVWLLQAMEGAYAMFEDNNGQEYIPVWPNEEMASKYIVDDWSGYKSETMPFYEFINWLVELNDDNVKIAISDGNDNMIIPIEAIKFKNDLLK